MTMREYNSHRVNQLTDLVKKPMGKVEGFNLSMFELENVLAKPTQLKAMLLEG